MFILRYVREPTDAVTKMDLSIWCGDTFEKAITFSVGEPAIPVPVVGWEFDGDIRHLVTGEVVGVFTFNILDADNGDVDVTLTEEQTDALAASSTVYSFQWRFKTPADAVQTFVEGLVYVTRRLGEES